jgi:histidinol-phosphate aminotransferase
VLSELSVSERNAIAEKFAISCDEVIAGNGSTEILYLLPRVISSSRAIIPVPSYLDYATAAELGGMQVEKMPLMEEEEFVLNIPKLAQKLRGDEIVIVGRPNNPTGFFFNDDELRKLAADHPGTTFIVDESFINFIEGAKSLITNRPSNVIVLFSFTKFYAIPGLRLGFAVADRRIIDELYKIMPPWSVNTIAQAVGTAAVKDAAYAAESRKFVLEERQWLQNELGKISGLKVYAGSANFLFVKINSKDKSAPQLAQEMLNDGIAIRVCDNFAGLDERFFRVAVRTHEENIRLCEALARSLQKTPGAIVRRKTKCLMVQGTG